MSIIVSLFNTVATGRNHHHRACGVHQCHQPNSVVAVVTHHRVRINPGDQSRCLRNVRNLDAVQYPAQRVAQRIHRRMNLRAHPAARAPERLSAFFFWAPAACWCARTTVLSISNDSKSRSFLTAWITRCHTLFLPQRENRVYVPCQLPNAGSTPRHGLPVRAIHGTASTNSRLSLPLAPGSPASPDSKSRIRSHGSSRISFLGIAHGLL
jgi:hypothetical protein